MHHNSLLFWTYFYSFRVDVSLLSIISIRFIIFYPTSDDLYLNYTLVGLAEIPACILCVLLMDLLGRRFVFGGCQVLLYIFPFFFCWTFLMSVTGPSWVCLLACSCSYWFPGSFLAGTLLLPLNQRLSLCIFRFPWHWWGNLGALALWQSCLCTQQNCSPPL